MERINWDVATFKKKQIRTSHELKSKVTALWNNDIRSYQDKPPLRDVYHRLAEKGLKIFNENEVELSEIMIDIKHGGKETYSRPSLKISESLLDSMNQVKDDWGMRRIEDVYLILIKIGIENEEEPSSETSSQTGGND